MGAFDKLKKGYFAVEDKYYAVLDKVNRTVPVYKVIDPIDKVVPSFALLIGLLMLFLLLMFSSFLPIIFPPQANAFTAGIQVLSADSNKPLKGATVIVSFGEGEKISRKTNDVGIAEIELPSVEAEAEIEVKADGYGSVSKTAMLKDGLTESFSLVGSDALFKPKVKIFVFNAESNKKILDRTISIKFTCSNGGNPDQINAVQSEKIGFETEVPEECGTLLATIKANGFKDKTVSLVSAYESATKNVMLAPSEEEVQTKGSLSVKVLDNDNNSVDGVLVRVLNAKTEELISSKYSKESGSAFFEKLDPGFYDILCDAGDGRTKTQKNVKVNAGENSAVSIVLPQADLGGASRKLFFKVTDKGSGEELEGVHAVIRMNGDWFKSIDTNSEGLPSVLIPIGSQDASKDFTAALSKEGYIMKIADLPVLAKNASATSIKLSKKIAPANFLPIALFTADKFNGVGSLDVSFDSSASFDPDGVIVSFDWDFGDGESSTLVNPQHSFDEVGNFTVSLTVKDNDGAESTVSRLFQVLVSGENAAPVAFISAEPWFGFIPLEVSFDASESFDSDGSIESFGWDFGDGETGVGETVSHSFDEEGVFLVKLTVKDNDNETGEFVVSIQAQENLPGNEAGDFLVKVQNDSGEPVEGALINLYRENHDGALNDPAQPIYSNADGRHLFEDVPLSEDKYYIKASKDPGLSGESSHKLVVVGQQTELVATLTAGKGTIEAFAHKQNQAVESAHVSFINSGDDLVIAECDTNSEGKCNSGEIVSGTIVIVKAAKENHLTAESLEIEVLADNAHFVSLELFEETAVNGIKAELAMVCLDSECTMPAGLIESHASNENIYYFKFNLLLEDSSKDVNFAVIAGDFSVDSLPLENYKIKITDVLSDADLELLSNCFDATNTFAPPSQCVGEGDSFKQAIAKWSELNSGGVSKTIIVKTAIEPGLSDGDTTELRFAANAIQNNAVVSQALEIIPIEISAPLCGSGQSIGWNRAIELNGVKTAITTGPEEKISLERGENYSIYYSLLNCFSAVQNIDVNAWNEDSTISFPGKIPAFGPFTVESISQLATGAVSQEKEIEISALKASDSTSVKLKAELDPAETTSETVFYFSVLSDKSLVVNGLPNFLRAGIPVMVSGTVFEEGAETKITGAIVNVKLNNQLIGEVQTDNNGKFFVQQTGEPLPVSGATVYVFVSAPGYNDFSIEIEVKNEGTLSLLDCVEIPSEPLNVTKGASVSFDITSINCPAPATINVLSVLQAQTPSFGLSENESKAVSVKASGDGVFQGIYPVEIKGTLEGAASQRLIGVVDVIVADPNSCFSLNTDTFTLDLLNQSQALEFTNKCFASNKDPKEPVISSDNAGASFELTAQKDIVPESVSLDWEINAFVEQLPGSNFDLKLFSGSATANPSESIVFELGVFSGSDAVTQIKAHSSFSNGIISNVRFVPSSSNANVEVWIEGGKVMGIYHGPLEPSGKYDVNVTNTGLAQTGYGFATIEDFVQGGGD